MFYIPLLKILSILNKTTDISSSINPVNRESIEANVNGIKKYTVSLNEIIPGSSTSIVYVL